MDISIQKEKIILKSVNIGSLPELIKTIFNIDYDINGDDIYVRKMSLKKDIVKICKKSSYIEIEANDELCKNLLNKEEIAPHIGNLTPYIHCNSNYGVLGYLHNKQIEVLILDNSNTSSALQTIKKLSRHLQKNRKLNFVCSICIDYNYYEGMIKLVRQIYSLQHLIKKKPDIKKDELLQQHLCNIKDKDIGAYFLPKFSDILHYIEAFTFISPFCTSINFTNPVTHFHFFSEKITGLNYVERTPLFQPPYENINYDKVHELIKNLNNHIYSYLAFCTWSLDRIIKFIFDWSNHTTVNREVDVMKILKTSASFHEIFQSLLNSNSTTLYSRKISNTFKVMDHISNLLCCDLPNKGHMMAENEAFFDLFTKQDVLIALFDRLKNEDFADVREPMISMTQNVFGRIAEFLKLFKKENKETLRGFRNHFTHGVFDCRSEQGSDRFINAIMETNGNIPDEIVLLPVIWLLAMGIDITYIKNEITKPSS